MTETPLAAFSERDTAYALASVLNTRHIAARVVEVDERFVVVLRDADTAAEARTLLDAFLKNPDVTRLSGAGWARQSSILARMRHGTGPVTWAVMLACAAIFGISFLLQTPVLYQALRFPDDPAGSWQWWRWITPIFLHFSLLHVAFNVLWWWELGRMVEQRKGSLHLLMLTLMIALFSNTSQFLFTGANFGGLSGVVYGVLAYLWIYGLLNPHAGYRIRPGIIILMVGWMAIGFLGWLDDVIGRMANLAHLMGFVSGAVAGVVFALVDRVRSGRRGG